MPRGRASRVAAALLAVAGLALATAAVRTGTTQLAARDARDALVAAASGRDPATQADARAALERALAREPHDAELREVHGRWALRDAALARDAGAARAAFAVAADDFRAALDERARWPYAWAGLATALDGAGADAAEVAAAVASAVRFGRNERRVNAELAELWLARRAVLPKLERAWSRALADAPQQWIDRADRAGRGRTACTQADLPAAARERCVELGWLTEAPPRG